MCPAAYDAVCTAIPVGGGSCVICGPSTGPRCRPALRASASKRGLSTVVSTDASPAFTITGATQAKALSPGRR